MKTPLAILALSLLATSSPALASASSAAEASRYFAADTGLSLGALVLAAGMMAAAKVSGARRRLQMAREAALPGAAWRNRVMHDLDADLQRFSLQLRRAA